ncbi:unnamed protein product, partial [Vitrella brassicaformis CCMP3155]
MADRLDVLSKDVKITVDGDPRTMTADMDMKVRQGSPAAGVGQPGGGVISEISVAPTTLEYVNAHGRPRVVPDVTNIGDFMAGWQLVDGGDIVISPV